MKKLSKNERPVILSEAKDLLLRRRAADSSSLRSSE
jgi:hypothetical protein